MRVYNCLIFILLITATTYTYGCLAVYGSNQAGTNIIRTFHPQGYNHSSAAVYDTIISNSLSNFDEILAKDINIELNAIYKDNKLIGFGVTKLKSLKMDHNKFIHNIAHLIDNYPQNSLDTISVLGNCIPDKPNIYSCFVKTTSMPQLELYYLSPSLHPSGRPYYAYSEIELFGYNRFFEDVEGMYEWDGTTDGILYELQYDNEVNIYKMLSGKTEQMYEVLNDAELQKFITSIPGANIFFDRIIYKDNIPVKSVRIRFVTPLSPLMDSWMPDISNPHTAVQPNDSITNRNTFR